MQTTIDQIADRIDRIFTCVPGVAPGGFTFKHPASDAALGLSVSSQADGARPGGVSAAGVPDSELATTGSTGASTAGGPGGTGRQERGDAQDR